MTLTAAQKRKFVRAAKALAENKQDPRYRAVVGRLIADGYLHAANMDVPTPKRKTKLRIQDALWAGEVEPRILELLPALLLKKPGMFRQPLPDDVAEVLADIRRRPHDPPDFFGVKPRDYMQWMTRIGHKGKEPSVSRTFRFSAADQRLIKTLREKLGATSDVAILRAGIEALARDLEK